MDEQTWKLTHLCVIATKDGEMFVDFTLADGKTGRVPANDALRIAMAVIDGVESVMGQMNKDIAVNVARHDN